MVPNWVWWTLGGTATVVTGGLLVRSIARDAPTGGLQGAVFDFVRPGQPQPRPNTTTRPGATRPGKPLGEVLDEQPGRDPLRRAGHLFTAWAVKEPLGGRMFDVPTGQRWRVDLLVLAPKFADHIRFPGKLGQKDYYWQAGPPDSAPVLEAVLDRVTNVTRAAAPAAGAALSAYGVPPGVVEAAVAVANQVLSSIPDKVGRDRVQQWLDWREGQRGDESARAAVREFVQRWRDQNPFVATEVASLCEGWRFEGLPSDRERVTFPLVEEGLPSYDLPRLACSSSALPDVWSEPLGNGWARIFVEFKPTKLGVSERRLQVIAREI
jgi:hypothetical protein